MNQPLFEAVKFAEKAHKGQKRKYTNEPYINHPFNVAGIVADVTKDTDMIVAAILHDVVEDTPVSLVEIENKFGERVARMVEDLTDVSIPSDGNRTVRKQIDLNHTASASADSKTIKLADLIDNSRSILERDPGFAKVYMKEKQALLEVLTEGDSSLLMEATSIVANYYEEQ